MRVFLRALFVTGIIASLLFDVNLAQAANVDYTGSFVNMGTLVQGQTGSITGSGLTKRMAISNIVGLLPAQSTVTFTYNFDGELRRALLASGSGYGGNYNSGLLAALSADGVVLNYNGKQVDKVSSTPLAVVTAQIKPDNTATVVIANHSSSQLTIISFLSAFLRGGSSYNIQYDVSAVPLPAALPMFGFGLAALVGLRRRKKQACA